MEKNKWKQKVRAFFGGKGSTVLILACCAILIFCAVKVAISLVEYRKGQDIYDPLTSQVNEIIPTGMPTEQTTVRTTITSETVGDETDAPSTPDDEPDRPVKAGYEVMYQMLKDLKKSYPELFGWIYIGFTDEAMVSLPVMKAKDNNYYISHAYDGTESRSGAIFADYRNTDRKLDLNQNLIFYGHNMNNNSMFAKISTWYKKDVYFQNTPVLFYTLDGLYLFEVFSVYNAKAGDDYDTIGFTNEGLKAYCEEKRIKSYLTKEIEFTDDETMLTLVTCTNYASTGRVIVHGVLRTYDSYFTD